MAKFYKLLKKYTSPTYVVNVGVIKSKIEWHNVFQGLEKADFDIKTDWFEPVIPEKNEIDKGEHETREMYCDTYECSICEHPYVFSSDNYCAKCGNEIVWV